MHLLNNSCGVIKFKSKDIPENIVIPKGGTFDDWDYPFISHGFIAGIKGRIGVPEFTIPRDLGVSIEDGTGIWKTTRDGKQTLYAVFKEGKFIVIK